MVSRIIVTDDWFLGKAVGLIAPKARKQMTDWTVSPIGCPSLRERARRPFAVMGRALARSGANGTRRETSVDAAPYLDLEVFGLAVVIGTCGKEYRGTPLTKKKKRIRSRVTITVASKPRCTLHLSSETLCSMGCKTVIMYVLLIRASHAKKKKGCFTI